MQDKCKNCKLGRFCEENNAIKPECKHYKPKEDERQEIVLNEMRY